MEKRKIIPYGRQSIDQSDHSAVQKVLASDFLTTGPVVDAFEVDFARCVEVDHAVAVSNGTTALHLASLALGLQPGDEVIVPSMTFLASANAQRMVGASVVFSDVDPFTGLMRPSDLEDAIKRSRNAKAVMVVHLNGLPADLAELSKIARAADLLVIEDACHALGSHEVNSDGSVGRPIGSCSHSDICTFSFHPVKTIACGEGGMVTTRSKKIAERVRSLRSHGMHPPEKNEDRDAEPWRYEMDELGWNCRLSAIHAGLGNSQLKRLPEFLSRRRELVELYDREFSDLSDTIKPVSSAVKLKQHRDKLGWHLYAVQCKDGSAMRLKLFNWLVEHAIRPQVHYFPVHRQSYYSNLSQDFHLPGADQYYSGVLSIPLFADMTDAEAQHVISAIKKFEP